MIFLRLVILRSSGPGRDHKVLTLENVHLNNDAQYLNIKLLSSLKGLNVGRVQEGGCAE